MTNLLATITTRFSQETWLRRADRHVCELLLVILFPVGIGASLAHGSSPDNNEYAVKAAFLFHFAQLTNWPSEAFEGSNGPLTFCTTGRDPFEGALETVLAGKMVKQHAIRILHLKQLSGVEACHVLFIGSSESSRLATLLGNLRNLPILTTGEAEGFVQRGGMIGFQREQERLRFEVNLSAAEKCNMSFSSELLSLAKAIVPAKPDAASH